MADNPWETTPGWEHPVYHAMTALPLFAGVPMGFFVADFLLTQFVTLFWWPALLVGLGLYGIAWIGTQFEPRWLHIAWEYILYHRSYEA